MTDAAAARTRDLLAIVIVNYASSDLISRLQGTEPLPKNCLCLIVDNWTSSAERENIRSLCEGQGWTLVPLQRNLGFGGGANAGAARALQLGATKIVFLNPDAVITSQAVTQLSHSLDEDPLALVSPRIVLPSGKDWFAGGTILPWSGRVKSTSALGSSSPAWLSGACLGMTAATYAELRGFESAYFMYWEDVDLSQRWLGSGGRMRVLLDVNVVHLVGATQQSEGKPPRYVYYNCRNRLWFVRANRGPLRRLAWYLTSAWYAIYAIRACGRSAVSSRPLAYSWAALSGTLLGLWRRPRTDDPPSAAPFLGRVDE